MSTTAVRNSGLELPFWLLSVSALFIFCCVPIRGLDAEHGQRKLSRSKIESTAKSVINRHRTSDWLLHDYLIPVSYDLKIQTFLPSAAVQFPEHHKFTFSGEVSILIECHRATDKIVMNLKKLNLIKESLSLTSANGQKIELSTPPFQLQPEIERVTFLLKSQLVPSKRYVFNASYVARLSEGLGGYYRSKYTETGQTKWLAVTHFECCQARMALPCFDEPRFKAQFKVTMVHPKDMVALSNQIPVSSQVSNGWNTTVFAQTPKMSTYLLAFSVNAFTNRLEFTTSNPPVLFRVWATPNAVNQTAFATIAGPVVLDYYAQLFNQPFPLKKQDMLAVPDFAAGAMENWGLVTYRETALLYDPRFGWQANKDTVASVVAHELAHQWFGDLVTMKWWSDIWLNEGFATLFENYGAGVILNEVERWDNEFPIDNTQYAMIQDQLSTTHAIYNSNVFAPFEIDSVFDSISYSKGSSLLKMLHYLLTGPDGKDGFILGLRRYLEMYKYSNADHNNLWDAIGQVVHKEHPVKDWNGNMLNIAALMNPWVEQPGFPLVTVRRDGSKVILTQERFILDVKLESITNFSWYMPIWYIQPSDENPHMVWLNKNAPTVFTVDSKQSVIMNYKQLSFCRINYDEASWRQIINLLQTKPLAIDVINRAQILDDAMNLARKGTVSYNIALGLTSYLTEEPSHLPWKAASLALGFIENMMIKKPEFEFYKMYVTKLLTPTYNKLGAKNNEYMKNLIFALACHMEMQNCVTKAKNYFRTFVDGCKSQSQSSSCSSIPAYHRRAVYCTGVREGGDDDFKFLWRLYENEPNAVEKGSLLFGICCTKNQQLIAKLLKESIDPLSTVRKQDVGSLFINVATNADARELIWPFFVSNVRAILEIHGENSGNFGAMIRAATFGFNTEAQVKEMEAFIKQYPDLKVGTVIFKEQLQKVKSNVQWMKSYYANVVKWLKSKISQ